MTQASVGNGRGLDRLPPQAVEVERAVLGAMLIDQRAVGRAIEILDETCFYHVPHGLIYLAILSLYERNEAVDQLTRQRLGQSTAVGIGGDPVIGSRFIDILRMFEADEGTAAVVMIGEIGGTAEEEAAGYIKTKMTKPVFAFIAGQTAPPGRRMGHAGAIISGGKGTAEDKFAALEEAGAIIVLNPASIGQTVAEHISV